MHYAASGIPAYKTSGGILWHQAFYQRGKKDGAHRSRAASSERGPDHAPRRVRPEGTDGQGRRGGPQSAYGGNHDHWRVVLPFMLNRFMLNEPEATVHVTVANTTDLLRSIDEGKLDFALVEGYFSGGDYDYQIYSTEKYIPVAGAAYQLQASSRGKKLLRTEDLLSEPILIREQGSGTREVLERILEGKNLAVRDFRKIHEINNLQVMKYLIREGRGITFLYEAAVRQELEQGILREIRLKDFSVEHDFYFVWRKGSIYGSEYKEIFKQLKGEEYDGKETRE